MSRSKSDTPTPTVHSSRIRAQFVSHVSLSLNFGDNIVELGKIMHLNVI